MPFFSVALLLWAVTSTYASAAAGPETSQPIEIRVVVVTMFEVGADTGDAPGEFQYWVEREHLDETLPFPTGYRALRLDRARGVLGVVTGVGNSRAAATMMALGLDPRFDLTHAYFVVAGIGGADPHVASLGSAVWSDWVVDGDLSHEIDAREIPSATGAEQKLWTTGYVPLGKEVPFQEPRADRFGDDGIRYRIDPHLLAWAFGLTRGIALADTPRIAARRLQFLPDQPHAAAHRPPFVLMGGNVAASTFWHGKLLSQWAHDWVAYQTAGASTYAVCGMEDSGTMQSLTFLGHAGRVDARRVLILRAVSNFDQQRDGVSAAESIAETKIRTYSAYLPALDSAYAVGHVVVDRIVSDWSVMRDQLPTGAEAPATPLHSGVSCRNHQPARLNANSRQLRRASQPRQRGPDRTACDAAPFYPAPSGAAPLQAAAADRK